MVEWFANLQVYEQATVLLALWGGLDLSWKTLRGVWLWWSNRREEKLRERFPDLIEMVDESHRWMLRRDDFTVQGKLFAHLLNEEIDKRSDLRRDYDTSFRSWDTIDLDSQSPGKWEWLGEQIAVLRELSDSLNEVSRVGMSHAAEEISDAGRREVGYAADRLGELYEEALHLGIRYQQIRSDDGQFQRVIEGLSKSVRTYIEAVERTQVWVGRTTDAYEKGLRGGSLGWFLPGYTYFYLVEIGSWVGLWEPVERPDPDTPDTIVESDYLSDLTDALDEYDGSTDS